MKWINYMLNYNNYNKLKTLTLNIATKLINDKVKRSVYINVLTAEILENFHPIVNDNIKYFDITYYDSFERCDCCKQTTVIDYVGLHSTLEYPIIIYFSYGNLLCIDCFLNNDCGLKSLTYN